MNKTIHKILVVFGLFSIMGCSNSPKPIDYGNDACHYCKMTIVDKIHGAELVTDKGKVFKFDATECMFTYTAEGNEMSGSTFWTNHYDAPTALISATEATFLISENLPSPMGAYVTAFENVASAEKVMANKGGELYDWEALKIYLSNK